MCRHKQPETRSQHETPLTLAITAHYEKTGILPGWGNERVKRLAKILNITVYELGALAGLAGLEGIHSISHRLRWNNWHPPVAIHFAVLEAAIVLKEKNIQTVPVMPFHLLEL